MSLRFEEGNRIKLSWQPVDDPWKPPQKADQYIVYTRIGDSDFDKV